MRGNHFLAEFISDSIVLIHPMSNCLAENRLTESRALSWIQLRASEDVLVSMWAIQAAYLKIGVKLFQSLITVQEVIKNLENRKCVKLTYSFSCIARNPFLTLGSSTIISINGPPERCAIVIKPAAIISTTAEI